MDIARHRPQADIRISPDGPPLVLRPVRGSDAAGLGDLFEALSPLARQRRFHGAVAGVAPARLQRMARVDPWREAALVVTAPAAWGERIVADARFVVDTTDSAAEFAIVVAEGWRGRGVGAAALGALQRVAADRGLRWLYGSVLADNLPMLALMRRHGFRVVPNRCDAQLLVVEWPVQLPPPTTVAGGHDVRPPTPGRLLARLRAALGAQPFFMRHQA